MLAGEKALISTFERDQNIPLQGAVVEVRHTRDNGLDGKVSRVNVVL